MLQTMSLVALLSISQTEKFGRIRDADEMRAASVRDTLNRYDETLYRNAIRAEVSIWGHDSGVQLRITEIGRIEVLSYEKANGLAYLEKREVSPDECLKLCQQIREVIRAFPDEFDTGMRSPKPNAKPTYFTLAYNQGALSEEVTFEGVDPADQQLVAKIQQLFHSLSTASAFAKTSPQLTAKALTQFYEIGNIRADRTPAFYSGTTVPQRYRSEDSTATGNSADGLKLTQVRFERVRNHIEKRYDLTSSGLHFHSSPILRRFSSSSNTGLYRKSRAAKQSEGSIDQSVRWSSIEGPKFDGHVDMPRADFLQLHATWIQIANHLLQGPPLPLKSAPEDVSSVLTVRFGQRTTRILIAGVDEKDAELMELLRNVESATKRVELESTAFNGVVFSISVQGFLLQ